MTVTTIYLGMALSETPKWWHRTFHQLVLDELLNLPKVDVSRFVGLVPTASPTDVHDYDLKLAQSADLMVALTRIPSLGLGYEVRSRVEIQKPTLLLQPRELYLTKMLRGAPHTTLVTYCGQKRDGRKAAIDIAAQVAQFL